jgi:hypothetical protein
MNTTPTPMLDTPRGLGRRCDPGAPHSCSIGTARLMPHPASLNRAPFDAGPLRQAAFTSVFRPAKHPSVHHPKSSPTLAALVLALPMQAAVAQSAHPATVQTCAGGNASVTAAVSADFSDRGTASVGKPLALFWIPAAGPGFASSGCRASEAAGCSTLSPPPSVHPE